MKKNPKALRQQVTSKGGTTEAAIRYFEQKNFRKIIQNAIKAARQRAVVLGKQKMEQK